MNFNGLRYEFEHTLAAAESVVAILSDSGPASLAVHPGAGATATVEMSLSPLAKVKAGTAKWLPTSIGTAGQTTVATASDIPAPVTAIRFTATGGAVDCEVLQ